MVKWVFDNFLARSSRPGYSGERGAEVPIQVVNTWIDELKLHRVQSIICLLGEDQLDVYKALPGGLLTYYRAAGFHVAHVPALDHKIPPLTETQLENVWRAYVTLPKPVLVHCSAGIDRTGRAIEFVLGRIASS